MKIQTSCNLPKRIPVRIGAIGSDQSEQNKDIVFQEDAIEFVRKVGNGTIQIEPGLFKSEHDRNASLLKILHLAGDGITDKEVLAFLSKVRGQEVRGNPGLPVLLNDRAIENCAYRFAFLEYPCRTNRTNDTEKSDDNETKRSRRWSLQRFAEHVCGESWYALHKPYAHGMDLDAFPGAGIVIRGIGSRAKIFPEDNYLQKRFESLDLPIPFNDAKEIYRSLLINTEEDLQFTQFAFFNGFFIVYNPRKMSKALVIFNDHFGKNKGTDREKKIAYLVPRDIVRTLLQKPMGGETGIDTNHMLYPKQEFGTQFTPVTSIPLLTGQEVLAEKDTSDALFGFAQLDLFMEAFGIFARGEYYENNQQHRDPGRLIDEINNWSEWTQVPAVPQPGFEAFQVKPPPVFCMMNPMSIAIDPKYAGFITTNNGNPFGFNREHPTGVSLDQEEQQREFVSWLVEEACRSNCTIVPLNDRNNRWSGPLMKALGNSRAYEKV